MRDNMKHTRIIIIFMIAACTLTLGTRPAFSAESSVSLNDFYRAFELSEITPKNMQSWPYYKYTSMNWDEYGLFGTVTIMKA